MRNIETSDFEAANVEYIEFWMMDPFAMDSISNTRIRAGTCILISAMYRRIFYGTDESHSSIGLPADGDLTKY